MIIVQQYATVDIQWHIVAFKTFNKIILIEESFRQGFEEREAFGLCRSFREGSLTDEKIGLKSQAYVRSMSGVYCESIQSGVFILKILKFLLESCQATTHVLKEAGNACLVYNLHSKACAQVCAGTLAHVLNIQFVKGHQKLKGRSFSHALN